MFSYSGFYIKKDCAVWTLILIYDLGSVRLSDHDVETLRTGSTKISTQRLQDFLMPGLRHAHTLQQLKSFNEYSPPGEYLIKTKDIK